MKCVLIKDNPYVVKIMSFCSGIMNCNIWTSKFSKCVLANDISLSHDTLL